MSDIFISYDRSDRESAHVLAQALERQGWSVWWDRNLIPGDQWSKIISKELRVAKCVIVIWSKSSVNSEWVENEAEVGKRRGILVPILIDEVEDQIPLGFLGRQAARLMDWKGRSKHQEFENLIKAIGALIGSEKSLEQGKSSGAVGVQHERPKTKVSPRSRSNFWLAAIGLVIVSCFLFWWFQEAGKYDSSLNNKPMASNAAGGPENIANTEMGKTKAESHALTIKESASKSNDAARESEIIGKDGAPMVLIPAGEFWMGSPDREGDKDEHPRHRVYLDAFYVDKFEMTVLRYAEFLRATGRQSPAFWEQVSRGKHDELPVVGVNWHDVDAYCRWAGKRLPTEAEWEKAARGTDSRTYPWGNEQPTASRANFGKGSSVDIYDGGLAPVGSYEAGKSPYGIYDLAGNVREWVADWYDESYYAKSPERNPKGPSSGEYRVLRDGSWSKVIALRAIHANSRSRLEPSDQSGLNGFRCAQDAPQ